MAKTKKEKPVKPIIEENLEATEPTHELYGAPLDETLHPKEASMFHEGEIGGIKYNIETCNALSGTSIVEKHIIDEFLKENKRFAEFYKTYPGYSEGKTTYQLFKIIDVVPSPEIESSFEVKFDQNSFDIKIYPGNCFDLLRAKEDLSGWLSTKQSYWVHSVRENSIILIPYLNDGYLPLVAGLEICLNMSLRYSCVYKSEDELPPVYGVTNTTDEVIDQQVNGVVRTMEDAIAQQEEAGLPDLTISEPEVRFNLNSLTTTELIQAIASRQKDRIRERKVLRLLREKLQ